MKKLILLFGMCLAIQYGYSQNVALKSNLLYDATSTINLGVEFALTDKLTLDISGNFNPWGFPQEQVNTSGVVLHSYDAIIKHWMLQPELRWWTCETFNGHFFGAHLHGGGFNVGGLSFLPDGWSEKGLQEKRFEGWLAGAGVSYGYHLILNNRLSLEFSLGLGYAYLQYDKYNRYTKSTNSDEKDRNDYSMHYFGPTKAAVSLVFMLY
ncbi:MAG: DUF3575 domain-containing protein [Tannerella sp.]|jgi:opacity protein-like surface antigen|nr:DUF3575 domain-containing protein [Tannerella sp.]